MTDTARPVALGTVAAAWRYPVKSMQGREVVSLDVGRAGIAGDRAWGVRPVGTDRVLSAKVAPELLHAAAADGALELPDGTRLDPAGEGVDEALSAWLGRDVALVAAEGTSGLAYDMTFDPPNDDAEVVQIPVAAGTFLDLAPVHLLTTATLAACAEARPDLDWDVRRFRPNLVLDVPGEAFVEQTWVGRALAVGDAVLEVQMPTVRCAMPLRAQPAHGDSPELARQAELFRAMSELNEAHPNHLGVYCAVRTAGTVSVGDEVALLDEG